MLPLNNWSNVVHYLRKKARFDAGRNPVGLEGALLTRVPSTPLARAKEAQPAAPVTTKVAAPQTAAHEPAKPAQATSKGEKR